MSSMSTGASHDPPRVLESRLLAPVGIVSGHSGGKYLIYECDRSIKFRFDKVRGDLVTLSGIFFDAAKSKYH